MEWLTHILWYHDKFLGIEWSVWKIVGWAGNAVFSSRVVLQWYATEKHKQVVVPVLFWWLSLIGSLLLLCYALFGKHDSVFIYAYALNWIPYIRNLMIHRQHKQSELLCPSCGTRCPPQANFCFNCAEPLAKEKPEAGK